MLMFYITFQMQLMDFQIQCPSIWSFNLRRKYSAVLVNSSQVLFCIMRLDAVSDSDLHIILLFSGSQIHPPCKAPSPQLEACIVSVPSLLLHRLAPAFPFSCCILLRAARTGDSSCHSHVLEVISRAIQLQGESSLKKVRETPLALHRMC